MTEAPRESSDRPGQMTAVMRAATRTGPKVLRVGVVRQGRVISERAFSGFDDVTVGPSERCSFVVPSRVLAKTHLLFQRVEKHYVLRYRDTMSGRVALESGISDLKQLRGQAGHGSDGSYKLRLSEDARGKIQIGELTFLFQFVTPAPRPPKVQVPAAATRGASGIDWRTTIIAAFAFLVHFMAIGAMYSDWLDPPVDDELSLAGLVETLDRLPPPPPPEEKPEPEEAADAPSAPPEKEATPAPTPTAIPDSGPLNEVQVAALSNELEQLSMATLGALSGLGPATEGVLSEGNVPTGALDAAAASSAGVGLGSSLNLGSAGGVVAPSSKTGLADIGTTKAGKTTSGTAAQVEGPKGSASVSSQVAAGSVDNASRIVSGMRAGFRRCFQRALEQNPDIGGSVRLTLTIGPGGEVSGVSASQSGNLPASVVSCVKGRAQAARFNAPAGGSAVVNVPVTFVKQ